MGAEAKFSCGKIQPVVSSEIVWILITKWACWLTCYEDFPDTYVFLETTSLPPVLLVEEVTLDPRDAAPFLSSNTSPPESRQSSPAVSWPTGPLTHILRARLLRQAVAWVAWYHLRPAIVKLLPSLLLNPIMLVSFGMLSPILCFFQGNPTLPCLILGSQLPSPLLLLRPSFGVLVLMNPEIQPTPVAGFMMRRSIPLFRMVVSLIRIAISLTWG